MRNVTVKLLQDRVGNIILFPTKKLYSQIKDRVEDPTVLEEGAFLNHGAAVCEFLDSLTASQRARINRDANSTWSIGIRLYDEHAWCLFGAAY